MKKSCTDVRFNFSRMTNLMGLTWDFQVVSRTSDDWTIPSEASWERSVLKTAVGVGAL